MDCLVMVQNSVPVSGSVPTQFKILPLGLVHSQRGDFLVDTESYSSIRQEFKDRQLEIPIDYEHQTLQDTQAPAAGWIKDVVLKSDGIYAVVTWTERATEYLKNREYKYCSPVIMIRNSDHKAVKLHSVALTNKPAIDAMTPIVNKAATAHEPPETAQEGPGDVHQEIDAGAALERLTGLLGLTASATLDDICEAVANLVKGKSELKLKADAMEFEARKMEVDGVINAAMKEGKISAAQREWAFRSAMADLDEFVIYLKTAPQVVPMGELLPNDSRPRRRVGSRSSELLGLTPDDIQKYGG